MLKQGQDGSSVDQKRSTMSLKERSAQFERALLITTAVSNGFSITDSAHELKISRATYYRKLGEEGLRELEDVKSNVFAEAKGLISQH